jgi:hypothetical protein
MLVLICLCILIMLVFLIIILFKSHHQHRIDKTNIEELQIKIATISKKKSSGELQLHLWEEIESDLRKINLKMGDLIFDLNLELFQIISEQNQTKRS